MKHMINFDPNFKNLSRKDNEIIKASLIIGLILGSNHHDMINQISGVMIPVLHADLDNLGFDNQSDLQDTLIKYLKHEMADCNPQYFKLKSRFLKDILEQLHFILYGDKPKAIVHYVSARTDCNALIGLEKSFSMPVNKDLVKAYRHELKSSKTDLTSLRANARKALNLIRPIAKDFFNERKIKL